MMLPKLLFTVAAVLVSAAWIVRGAIATPTPVLGSSIISKVPTIDCSVVLCLFPNCGPGQTTEVPEGQCCPVCVPDCSVVSCLKPVCEDGQLLVTPRGECCPQCVPDCSAVSCLKPVCEDGQLLVTPQGECCPQCVPNAPDCSAVLCLKPVCEDGQQLITPEGECCPKCIPDCSAVSCLLPVCQAGERLQVPEGECCPQCVPNAQDCSLIDCAKPLCEEGEELVTPEGKCCPKCQPVCEIKGQTFTTCASACPATCDDFGPKICPAVCIEGCECPSGQVIDSVNKVCVTPDECPDIDPCTLVDCQPNSVCKVDPGTGTPFCEPSCDLANGGCRDDQLCTLNQVLCVTTPCPPEIICVDLEEVCSQESETGPCKGAFDRFFYNATSGQCEKFSYGGCEGNENRFETQEECVQTCSNPCIGFVCQRGSTCKVDDGTGEAFCDPSCELDNGGCQSDEICELQIVQCVRAPCPPVVNCRNPCATVRCANGYRCEVYKPTGEAFCNPDCSLNNGGCPADQECRLQPVQCVRAPCPPVIECVERSSDSDCPPTCSKEFCSKKANRRAMCSNPGPREIPGCTGPCQLTYCHTCYYNESSADLSDCPQCQNLQNYLTDSRCFRRWANCVRRNQRNIGNRDQKLEENFKCRNPPCPLRG